MAQGDLVIIGAGGHARIVVDAAVECGYTVVGIIDLNYKEQEEEILGVQVVGGPEALGNFEASSTSAFVAIGNNESRRDEYQKLLESGYRCSPLIHPKAIMSQYVEVGNGTLVNAGVVVNAGTVIGQGCIVNTNASLEHEVVIGDYTHIAPGVTIGGRTKIGSLTFVGLGTSIIDFINVGDNVTIGAGSTIIKDVESGSKVVGIGRILE